MIGFKRRFALLSTLVGVGFASGAYAGDAQIKSWANNVSLDWLASTIWENGYVPTNASDTVNLYVPGNAYRLALRLNGDVTVDSVTNGPLLGCYGANKIGIRLSIRKADGFNVSQWPFGYVWGGGTVYNPAYVGGGVNFLGTADEPTRFRLYSLGSFPNFGVPNAGGAGRIDHLVDTGIFLKDGPGDLCLGSPCELTTALMLREGSVSFDAREEACTDQPAGDPFFHVDASSVATRLGYEDMDSGRSYVTNWYDVRQNGMVARAETWSHASYNFTCSAPYLADHTVNGRALVDFGERQAAQDGQSATHPAASMLWSQRTEKIREIFLAVEICGPNCQPIGESSDQILGMCGLYGTVFYSDPPARGDVRVNGASAAAINGHLYDSTKLRIVSCALPSGTNAKAGWFGRYGSTAANPTVGGFRLGEALVYTNDLTEAERRQTIAYLKRRWMPESTHKTERVEWDLGDIETSSDGQTISVAAGNVARVRRITGSPTAGFVKEGAGTLAVDRIEPSAAPVTVKGGTLRLTDTAGSAVALTVTTLPADPIYHFDATDADSVKIAEGTEQSVEHWCDIRGTGYPVTTNMVDAMPIVHKAFSPTGLDAIEFEAKAVGWQSSTAARMKFGSHPTCEGFMIWKSTITENGSKNTAHFCPVSAYRDRNKLLPCADMTANNNGVGYGVWTVNGATINPFADEFTSGGVNGEWMLIHFTAARPITIDSMANLSGSYGGGCAIGEMIGYDRVLTDQERRGVEAYLMERWLGKTHPDNIPWAGALTFADGVSAVIDADCDIAPISVATTSATLTKKGSGTATVGSLPASVTTLAVEEGTLAAPPAALANVSALSVGIDEDGAKGTLTVDGTYAIPATFNLTVSITSEQLAKSLRGTRVKLIGATAVTDRANLAGWNVTATGFGRVRVSLAAADDGIYLNLLTPGMAILVR